MVRSKSSSSLSLPILRCEDAGNMERGPCQMRAFTL